MREIWNGLWFSVDSKYLCCIAMTILSHLGRCAQWLFIWILRTWRFPWKCPNKEGVSPNFLDYSSWLTWLRFEGVSPICSLPLLSPSLHKTLVWHANQSHVCALPPDEYLPCVFPSIIYMEKWTRGLVNSLHSLNCLFQTIPVQTLHCEVGFQNSIVFPWVIPTASGCFSPLPGGGERKGSVNQGWLTLTPSKCSGKCIIISQSSLRWT